MARPTLRLRRYVAGDAALIRPRPGMAAEAAVVSRELLHGFIPDGDAWTVTQDGEPIACGGLMPIWRGRWCAWTWIGRDLSMRAWLLLTDTALSFMVAKELLARVRKEPLRIEATSAFPEGCDWLHKLGFEAEGVLKAYGPDGGDYALYARTVKP